MHTGLIAAGAGVLNGLALPLARQIDIAPTAARLLGVEFRNVDGVPLVGLLRAVPETRRPTAAGGY
jgi:hypothetical protein